jgi:hypothetical protein
MVIARPSGMSPGSHFATGSVSASRWSAASCKITVATIVLVLEPIRNWSLAVRVPSAFVHEACRAISVAGPLPSLTRTMTPGAPAATSCWASTPSWAAPADRDDADAVPGSAVARPAAVPPRARTAVRTKGIRRRRGARREDPEWCGDCVLSAMTPACRPGNRRTRVASPRPR